MIEKNKFKKPKNSLEFEIKGKNIIPVVPDDMYIKCKKCKATILAQDFNSNNSVCPNCGDHYRLGARKRIALIADEGNFTEFDIDLISKNILEFPEYEEKLEKAKINSGEKEGVITGVCKISGIECGIFSMESSFMMGSMGAIVGEKITNLFEYATKNKLPVIGFTVSGGARMQEGMFSLMQMAKTSGAVKLHSEAGLLYIAVLTDPTTGGVTASFAMEADIILAEPNATVGFAGARVIEQTIRQKLPIGFQTSEFVLDKGFIDNIVYRNDLKNVISQLLNLHNAEVNL
jgi:acetyl-CoA carboxylase carboxyl transferase subunit beta